MSDRIIVLKGSPIVKEAKAGEAGILPGHRLILDSAGDVVRGGAAGALTGATRRAFAVEADVIGNTAADVYADNDQVKYVVGAPGDEVNVRLASGLTFDAGDDLFAGANGQFTDVPGSGIVPIGIALASAAGSSADDLVAMEVS